MAVQQRIIGGGLLLVGIAVVLILIFKLAFDRPLSPDEARDRLLGEVYPAWRQAVDQDDYLATKRRAQEVLDVLEGAGRNAAVKALQGEAGNREARLLLKLIEGQAFEKNVAGSYELDGSWYDETAHRSLKGLKQAVETDLKLIRDVRDLAARTRKLVEEAALGSGVALAPPAAQTPADEAPIVDPNPVYASDAELYRVFGLSPADLEKALGTKGESARAKSARLRWNQAEGRAERGRVAAALDALPETADRLARTGVEIQRNVRNLRGDEQGAKKLAALLAKAAAQLGAGLEEPHRAAFEAARAKFESGEAIASVLANEAAMLKAYRATVRELGKAVTKDFAPE